jgi:hypothetical protein
MNTEPYDGETLPPCDGTGELHNCVPPVAPLAGPHYYCQDAECPGCENCKED